MFEVLSCTAVRWYHWLAVIVSAGPDVTVVNVVVVLSLVLVWNVQQGLLDAHWLAGSMPSLNAAVLVPSWLMIVAAFVSWVVVTRAMMV